MEASLIDKEWIAGMQETGEDSNRDDIVSLKMQMSLRGVPRAVVALSEIGAVTSAATQKALFQKSIIGVLSEGKSTE